MCNYAINFVEITLSRRPFAHSGEVKILWKSTNEDS